MELMGCLFLIGTGFLMMVVDLVLPTGGVVFALGLAITLIGTILSFGLGMTKGIWVLGMEVIAVPLILLILGRLGPRLTFLQRILYALPDNQIQESPVQKSYDHLIGRVGLTLSTLRPSGAVEFDGTRIDTLTEGIPVEAGELVRCFAVREGKVFVEPLSNGSTEILNPSKSHEFDMN